MLTLSNPLLIQLGNQNRFSPAVCTLVFAISAAPFLQAKADNPALVEQYLNDSLALTSSSAADRAAACQKIKATQSEIRAEAGQGFKIFKDILKESEQNIGSFCGNAMTDPDTFSTTPDYVSLRDTEQNVTGINSTANAEWTSQPHCNLNGFESFRCTFNHGEGRGIYVGRKKSNGNYLICVLRADLGSTPFSSNYVIDSRCAVSSLDWRTYANMQNWRDVRSDVGGVLTWVDGAIGQPGIKMPVSLQKQCETGFQEANICTPTLISLPTESENMINLCQLHTNRFWFGLGGLISISSASSSWNCQLMDMNRIEDKSRLTVDEDNCLPDMLHNVDSSCVFPTIPRTQEPFRQRTEVAN